MQQKTVEVQPDDSPTSLPAAIDEFFLARRPRKDSAHTQAAYRRDLDHITRQLAAHLDRSPPEIRLADVDTRALRTAFGAYAEDHAKSSLARAWSTWNQFFTFCVAEGHVTGNPMGAIDRPRMPSHQPKPLRGENSPEQLLHAIAAGSRRARDPWPERDLAVIATLLLTGLRSAELLDLNLGDLSGRAGERRLRVRGKGGNTRSTPVEPALQAVLDAYLDSREHRFPTKRVGDRSPLFVDRRAQRLRRGGLQYLVRSCYRWAGLHDQVPTGALVHALRHTFATRLAEDGAGASEIMRLLGHSSMNASQAYIEVTSRAEREAARSNRTYGALGDLVEEPRRSNAEGEY